MDYSQSQSSGGKTTVIHALRVADNLPEDASHDWLTRMFNDYGVVKEVFIIPAKRSRASGELIGILILQNADQYDAWLYKSAVAKPHNKLTMEELKEELVLEGLSNMDFRSIGGGEAAILECKDG
ncbi:hypothetical protein RHGRI_034549 [Rhododendron griersonianum]|uniref:RRM domain-containing protein n=1 Tax=Rhododendron griersonianum TaxID=479676 RepID=A0AAV6I718_9ERIC|nr:hypothetical protein RHGRI_034549 [Rhododendron griersonianum]